MQYKRKKYIKHKLSLDQIIISSSFVAIAQLRSTDISEWISIKQKLLKYKIRIKLCSLNLLKKNSILHRNELILAKAYNVSYDRNLYYGNVVLLYSIKSNLSYLNELVKTMVNTKFFVPLSIYFQTRFQSLTQFRRLLTLKLDKTENSIPLLLRKNNLVNLLRLEIGLFSLFTKMSLTKNQKT